MDFDSLIFLGACSMLKVEPGVSSKPTIEDMKTALSAAAVIWAIYRSQSAEKES
jgi:hypothetical protein